MATGQMGDDSTTDRERASRLRWQCRRGMKELDQLLTSYLDNGYESAPEADKAAFRALLKLSDPMTRLHAPTKAGTVGTGAFLMASMLHSIGLGHSSFHEVLILAFLFVTAPVTANFISRVNIHRRTCDTPPSPPNDETWSTLNVPEEDRVIVERDELKT